MGVRVGARDGLVPLARGCQRKSQSLCAAAAELCRERQHARCARRGLRRRPGRDPHGQARRRVDRLEFYLQAPVHPRRRRCDSAGPLHARHNPADVPNSGALWAHHVALALCAPSRGRQVRVDANDRPVDAPHRVVLCDLLGDAAGAALARAAADVDLPSRAVSLDSRAVCGASGGHDCCGCAYQVRDGAARGRRHCARRRLCAEPDQHGCVSRGIRPERVRVCSQLQRAPVGLWHHGEPGAAVVAGACCPGRVRVRYGDQPYVQLCARARCVPDGRVPSPDHDPPSGRRSRGVLGRPRPSCGLRAPHLPRVTRGHRPRHRVQLCALCGNDRRSLLLPAHAHADRGRKAQRRSRRRRRRERR
eukprot:Amastigsp_a514957_30.p2 type:complete len:362 gc:universal Amastigsp_a514957_30:1-1086(+)